MGSALFWVFVCIGIVIVKALIEKHNEAVRRRVDEPTSFRCERVGCGAINPSSAVYCRRCGERARGSPMFHEPIEVDQSPRKRSSRR